MHGSDIKKTFNILLALALAAAPAAAYRSVKVCRADGSAVVVEGESGMTAKFAGPDLTFEVGGNVLLSIPVEEVRGWQLSDESGVAMTDAAPGIRFAYESGCLVVSGLPDGARLRVLSLAGVIMTEARASSGGCRIDLSEFSEGVYVMSCNGSSMKIHIRR